MKNKENPEVTQNSLSIAEKNMTCFNYPSHAAIHKLFTEQASRIPRKEGIDYSGRLLPPVGEVSL